ncbi:hypothetical protein BgAZ_104700 [Babesia gibsoni]|uniref:Uncharacterized protein n=1 Tax=Babesia gibsoni TaxID=33632 RepID=A0AAD8PFR3_BABGI|nr:hypothetical protein BgAZ_104700 [Babesia gibsoni]
MSTSFTFNTAPAGGTSLFGSNTAPAFGATAAPTFGQTAVTPGVTGGVNPVNTVPVSQQPLFAGVGTVANQVATPMVNPVISYPGMINSRFTIRHLTSVIPQWKGHFDVADMMLSSQERSMSTVRGMIDMLDELDKECRECYDNIKNSLNGINLLQEKLKKEVKERCKRQDSQNLISIKARRLSESLGTAKRTVGSKISPVFRVPNHLHLQLSKELLDIIRSWKKEIHLLQIEVLSLKDIDISRYVSTVKVVLASHEKRISNIGNCLTKAVSGVETKLSDSKDMWDIVADKTSDVRKAFLEAIGLPIRPSLSESTSTVTTTIDPGSEIKRQIVYLRKFNSAFEQTGRASMDAATYNIRELLQQPTQVTNTTSLFGGGAQNTGLFGGTTSGGTAGSSIFGNTASTGMNMFGSNTANVQGGSLFGAANKTAGTGLFGSTPTQTQPTATFGTTVAATPTTGLFGSTTGGVQGGSTFGTAQPTTQNTGIFGSATTGTTGTSLFGSGTAATPSTGGFGVATTATTTTPTMFGASTTTTGGSGLFGTATSATNPVQSFGQPQAASTGVFGSSGNTGMFGQQTTTTGFGQQTTTTGFGQQSNTTGFGQQTNTTGFGQQPGAVSTPTASTGLFGQSNVTGIFGQNTAANQQGAVSKSTALVPYNPNAILR